MKSQNKLWFIPKIAALKFEVLKEVNSGFGNWNMIPGLTFCE